jgi:RNA polymerase subunit RPABC4/transcription elongation factor Spt4
MSDLFDKLVESAGQVISEVDKGGQIQSAIGGLRQRMADAERNRKINQIKQQIRDLQSQEAQTINALSAQVLALHEAGTLTQPELVSLCRGVDEIRAQMREQQADLEKVQPSPPEPTAAARCPHCGAVVVAGAAFCQTCGGQLAEEVKPTAARFCVHCGAQLREGARFCPKCGQTVPQS